MLRDFLRLPDTLAGFYERKDRMPGPPIPATIASTEAPKETKKEPNKSTKETKKEEVKMKKWPDNSSELLSYNEIIAPIADVIRKGYRLFRKDDVKSFEYDGFNIGRHELSTQPSPKIRLSEKFLKYEKTLGHTLMDVMLNITFLMGVEQGRRAERRDSKPVESLIQTLENYREKNKNFRIKIDELEVELDARKNYSYLSNEELQEKIKIGLEERRKKRIQDLKTDLELDKSKTSFVFKGPRRAKFKHLDALHTTMKSCTAAEWSNVLREHGWTDAEWKNKLKRKFKIIRA